VLTVLLLLACGGASEEDAQTVGMGLESFSPGMWEQRALTIASGIDEALELSKDGKRTEAVALVEAVYTGSYEPELEVAIRDHLGVHVALELELEFGRMMKDINRRKERDSRAKNLNEQVGQAAAILESKAASLRLD
jgi:hypothetical protein